jgi:hypothetical protein
MSAMTEVLAQLHDNCIDACVRYELALKFYSANTSDIPFDMSPNDIFVFAGEITNEVVRTILQQCDQGYRRISEFDSRLTAKTVEDTVNEMWKNKIQEYKSKFSA